MRASLRWFGRVGFSLLLMAGAIPVEAGTLQVTVRNSGDTRGETPVVVALGHPLAAGVYRLKPVDAAQADAGQAAQVFSDEGKSYLAFILEPGASAGRHTYTLEPAADSTGAKQGVALQNDGANIKVIASNSLLTEYLSDQATKPYYYPVIGPTGAKFTREFPMAKKPGDDTDHNHQRSLWFSHGDVNGFDFWASDPLNAPKKNFGSIKETARKTLVAGPVLALIRTTDDWLGPDGKRVCEDERVVTFYDTREARVIDFDVTLKGTESPATFGDTKEGMFGLRVASSMDVKKKKQKADGTITNAEGITDDAAWGKASPWVDYVGPVDGQTVGIAILNHPDSFRYPTTWHVRDYGLFAANPFGWHDFGMKKPGAYTLAPGDSIRFRYRVILHKGDTQSAGIASAFEGYRTPPTVEIKGE